MALAAILAVGLAAAQVLPTAELTTLSNRSGGLPFREALSFSLRPQIVGRALLPGFGGDTPLFSEYVAYVGVAGLMLALIGLWSERHRWRVLGLGLLAALGLFFALGAYNPVYWALVRFVPGFGLFRAPARWLALYALATAGLVGVGLDALAAHSQPDRLRRLTVPIVLAAGAVIVLAGLCYLAPLSADEVAGAHAPRTLELIIWSVTILLTGGSAAWLATETQPGHAWALAALAVVELFAASQALPLNALSAPEAWASQRPAISTLLAAEQGQTPPARLLALSDILFDPGDLREMEAIYGPYLNDKALYDLIIASKQKEVLTPNLSLAWGIPTMDGFDGGILPTRAYTRFTSLFLSQPAPDGRLREYLSAVPDLAWLRLADVGWIITDKVQDLWQDGVYYDLQLPARLDAASAPVEALPEQPFDATTIAVIAHLENADGLASGTQVGTVAVFDGSNPVPLVQPLLVGRDVSPGDTADTTRVLVRWGEAIHIDHVEISIVSSFPGTLVVRGASLLDERSGAFLPTTLSPGGVLRLVHSGDVKLYAYNDTLPRASLVCAPERATNDDDAFARLAADPQAQVVVAGPDSTAATCDASAPGSAQITAYAPETVAVQVDARGEGVWLFLSDAWYPGWEADVDGQPVAIAQANGLFRAVPVPSGTHAVTFTYHSRPLAVGAIISGMCLLGVIVGLVVRWPRREPVG